MNNIIESQLRDALCYMAALNTENMQLSEKPEWGEGVRLWLPNVIPLRPDYGDEEPVAWLVANDFGGYDLSTKDPGGK